MRRVECPHCGQVVDEASVDWDFERVSGACTNCGKMLDTALEARAAMLGTDRKIVRRTRLMRVNALVVALLSGIVVVLTILAVLTGTAPSGGFLFWGLVLGVPALLFALLYRPVDEARKDLKGPTNLERLRRGAKLRR